MICTGALGKTVTAGALLQGGWRKDHIHNCDIVVDTIVYIPIHIHVGWLPVGHHEHRGVLLCCPVL
jgi:hypothetical protein